MIQSQKASLQLTWFLVAFFIVWILRATLFYSIDESIASPIYRVAYSDLLKLMIWVVPAAAFGVLLRKSPPAEYLGLSVWPSARTWARSFGVTFLFLLAVMLVELKPGKKVLSATPLVSLPLALWILQLLLSPFLEELLFRGLVMKELGSLLPSALASSVTSLLFVGVHLPYWIAHGGATRALVGTCVGLFVFSLVACSLYAKSGSIWPPTLLHIANNTVAMMLVTHAG